MLSKFTARLKEVVEVSVELGLRIRALRRLKRVTQQELAGRVQISVAMLSSIERGRRLPGLQLLESIAAKLGVPRDELLILLPEGENRVKETV